MTCGPPGAVWVAARRSPCTGTGLPGPSTTSLRDDMGVDLASTAPNNVWLITYSLFAGIADVLYWNGQGWQGRLPFGRYDLQVSGITTLSPNDVWLVAQPDE